MNWNKDICKVIISKTGPTDKIKQPLEREGGSGFSFALNDCCFANHEIMGIY